MTQNEKLVQFFRRGGRLTPSLARSRFGVTRLSQRIAELRAAGIPVYNNGGVYQLGLPRAVIAEAYAKRGASIFA